MKTILLTILLLLSFSCKQGLLRPPPPVELCKEGTEPACTQPQEEVEETLPAAEPLIEEEEEHQPYYYNRSLYLKKFSFWGYNFVSQNRIDKHSYTVFRSTNTRQEAIGSQFITTYAVLLFKDGEQAKIQYYNTSNVVVATHLRDWVIYDDLEFHIDGYRFGSFGWHSKLAPTLKTQDENDDGVLRYTHTINQYIETNCYGSIINVFTQECVDKYLITDIYDTYYYD